MKTDARPKELTVDFRLTAAGCTAQKELPLSMLVRQIIETATAHANLLGIGYNLLIERGHAWVLSRLSMKLENLPRMHSDYSLSTWIEKFNRHFSTRNFLLCDDKGNALGRISTVWVAIDIKSRQPADLSYIPEMESLVIPSTDVFLPQERIKNPEHGGILNEYAFTFTDIDFNRHVTTARYVELMLNQLPLDFYDKYAVNRFDIAFHHEAVWNETVKICSQINANQSIRTVITNQTSAIVCSNQITFKERTFE